MKAAFALLADTEVHNLVRRLSWDIHQKYHTGTRHCCLPPHISLKQPFRIANIPRLEGYMDEFARSMEPFEVTLTSLDIRSTFAGGIEYGILWIDVFETTELRQLHNRLNQELEARFGSVPADFDGEAYHFHMTVMIGGQPVDVYRHYYSEIDNPMINCSFVVRELGMFVYDEPMGPNGDYLSYRIVPLGKSN